MDILGQSSLLVAVTSFALGVSLLAKNVRNKLYLAYFLLTVLVSFWSLSFFLEIYLGGGAFYRFHLFCNAWLAPAGLVFIQELSRFRSRGSRLLVDGGVVLASLLSIALGMGWESEPWLKQLIYYAPVLIVVQTLYLIWNDYRTSGLRDTRPSPMGLTAGKRASIYIGALVVLATSVMDHVPMLGRWIPSFGNVLLTLYLFFISQAISQQRLLNMAALFSRFLVLLAVALTLTALYSLLFGWIQDSPALFFLNSFFVSFLILMLLDPLRSVVRYFTQRLLTQEYKLLEESVREAQRKLTGVVSTDALTQSVLTHVQLLLSSPSAAIYVLASDATRYRRVRTVGESHPDIQELLADHPLLKLCERLNRKGKVPVILDQVIQNEMDRSASRSQKGELASLIEGLEALDANLLIPLFESDQILGFVVCRAEAPPEPWGGSWGLLPLIYPYFEGVARSLRSMEIFAKQKEKERLAALGEMAAGLAHEIRNPLGAIKGAAQLLDSNPERKESRFVQVIIEEVDRLDRVVSQFLDYSRRDSAPTETVHVPQLLERTMDLLSPSLKPDVQLVLQKTVPGVQIQGSAVQIHQLILNLIQNALKAIDSMNLKKEETQWVRVSCDYRGPLDCGEMILSVEDNGPGIRREHLGKIFIPFFTTSPQGTGLGLSICQRIAESHGGRIEVSSEHGKGSVFTLILPAKIALPIKESRSDIKKSSSVILQELL